ncbi:oligosaccharide repeat unit polymerase [Arsenicibacter rosenii]|uniref:Oligosaccharide repeat unit polymerase n=1 Tax=Arsenicibacter rosenii TaxID=1750698 RepID=A0A1S2VNC8_9BACT|nr:oligosaccharide repeat unit polymerase [Arsenicibacter rosenii]OIN60281.1 hypothetical protein BLX24_05470 [Arsenicibacter rosenii]
MAIWLTHLIGISIIGSLYHVLTNSIKGFGYLDLYGLVWGLLLIGAPWIGPPFVPALSTQILYYLTWLLFLLPSFWVFRQPILNNSMVCHPVRRVKYILWFMVSMSMLANGWMLLRISSELDLLRFGWFALRFQGQRLQAGQSNVFYQLFARNFLLYLPMAFWLFMRKAIRREALLIICFIALLTASLSLTRAPILLWSLTILTSLSIFKGLSRRRVRQLALFLFSPVLLVTLSFNYTPAAFWQVTKVYLWGGAKVYESLLDQNYPGYRLYDSPYYSLDFLNYTAQKTGLIQSYPSLVRDYAPGPVTTNVYTYLDAFTLDFGVAGALFAALTLGWLAAVLHRRAFQYQAIPTVCYYAFVNYAIAMSFMNHELIRINAFLLAIELWLIHHLLKPERAWLSQS